MARKHKPEEIISKLREAEIVLAQGGTVADACRRIGVTEHQQWLEGAPEEAFALCKPYYCDMRIEGTNEPWVRR